MPVVELDPQACRVLTYLHQKLARVTFGDPEYSFRRTLSDHALPMFIDELKEGKDMNEAVKDYHAFLEFCKQPMPDCNCGTNCFAKKKYPK